MYRRTALVASLAAAALALTACGSGTSDKGSGSNDELVVGLVLEPTNLDIRHTAGAALEQILVDNVYQGLVTRTQDNEIVDSLAASHEISADKLTYSFTLKDGVKFADGSPLTSEDVVSSFTAVKDDATIQGHGEFADVASITADGDKGVKITLSKPNQNFLFSLTGAGGLVFASGDKTDLKTTTNGSGPFVLSNWRKGDSISFTRNKDYWGKAPALSEVTFRYITDRTAAVNAAVSGDLDVLTEVNPQLQKRFDKTDYSIVPGRTTDKGVLAFNNAKAPLNDPRVRKAIRLAIDHKGLVDTIGASDTLYGPITELDPGYEDLSALVPHDVAKAKQLLAEAGQSNLNLTLTIPNFYESTISQVLASDLAEAGITLKVNSVEFTSWINDVYTNKNYDLSFVRHVEPRDFGNFANPNYYFNYNNPEVKKLYTESLEETDAKKSEDLLRQAAKVVSEDDAADFLFVAKPLAAVSSHVKNFPKDSINVRINLADVQLTD